MLKRFLFLILFIFQVIFVNAQSWEVLYKDAQQLHYKHEYEKAALVGEQCITAAKKEIGEDAPDYATCVNQVAVIYFEMRNYAKAEPLYILALGLRKKILGEDHPDYATTLNNLALLYASREDFEKALPLYLKVKAIRKKIVGEKDIAYGSTISELGELYCAMGEYEKGEPLFIEVMAIYKNALGDNNADYANNLNDLALLYENLGQFDKAEKLYIEAKNIRKKIVGEDHADYATGLSNLAGLYSMMGQYQKAEALYLHAKAIRLKVLGENHPTYAANLNNLAELYRNTKQFEKAEQLYLQSIEIRKKVLGVHHPAYANSLNNLGLLYDMMGKYTVAESLYLEAKEIIRSAWGEDHPVYYNILNNLAFLYSDMGQFEKAEPLIIQCTNTRLKSLKNNFAILSENEKDNYIKNSLALVRINNSFIYNRKQASPDLAVNNYNLQLFIKSLSLSDTRNMLNAISNSTDSTIKKLFREWQADKLLLAKQYSIPVPYRITTLDSVERNAEAREKELSQKSSAFRKESKTLSISMYDVQKAMKTDEAAIDFVRFRLFNKFSTDSIMYAAYVLKKNEKAPAFVYLCQESQLQKLFSVTGKTNTAMVSSLYRGAGEQDDNITVSKGDSLYKLMWQPLEPYLKGISKINYTPAGKFYTIAFNALPIGNGKILMDKYELQQCTSNRQIAIDKQQNIAVPSGITLFGDATFSMDSALLANQKSSTTCCATNIFSASRGGTNFLWNGLPGTAEEVKTIQQLFLQNKIESKIFTQQQASEENLKLLSGNSPQVLHIATHGFFLQEPDKNNLSQDGNVYSYASDPLMRSGLILAGGNYAWSGKVPINGVEDGIVTAYEISQLDLSKTELVVLSACETALGDIKGNEGVFGLQRAFKMAGVKKLIVSLWQVPDKETSELMTIFYSGWLHGNSIERSFYKAQSEMRKKYSPYYWAAFVLVE